MRRLIALLCLLSGCGLMPDRSYVLDGVPVTLKNGQGPDVDHLALAVQLYRREARDHWSMTSAQELQVWRSLRRLVWTGDTVLNRANYRADVQIVYANWLGCALDVPFYVALTDHYWDGDPSDEAIVWAEDVHDDNVSVVCNGDEGWFW